MIRFILFLPKRFFAGSGVRVEPGVLRPGKGFLFCRRDNDELAFQSSLNVTTKGKAIKNVLLSAVHLRPELVQ